MDKNMKQKLVFLAILLQLLVLIILLILPIANMNAVTWGMDEKDGSIQVMKTKFGTDAISKINEAVDNYLLQQKNEHGDTVLFHYSIIRNDKSLVILEITTRMYSDNYFEEIINLQTMELWISKNNGELKIIPVLDSYEYWK